MAPSTLPALAALVVALCCTAAAHKEEPEPWPSCDLLYNWYWCRGHHEGGIICDTSVKRGSTEPLAVRWARDIEAHNESHVPLGQDDFGFIYNFVNYAGELKFTLRYCSRLDRTFTEPLHWHHKGSPPCKKNWYHCDLVSDRISCQLRLCPWSPEPLLPVTGKADDWFGCTKHGNQIDCYLSTLGERKQKHKHSLPHVVYPEFHHEYVPHHEYAGPEHDYHGIEPDYYGPGPEFVGPLPEPIPVFPPPPPPPVEAWQH